jgi:hypothetical protein
MELLGEPMSKDKDLVYAELKDKNAYVPRLNPTIPRSPAHPPRVGS